MWVCQGALGNNSCGGLKEADQATEASAHPNRAAAVAPKVGPFLFP